MKKLDQKEIDEISEKAVNDLSERVNYCVSNILKKHTTNFKEDVVKILKVYEKEVTNIGRRGELKNLSRDDFKALTDKFTKVVLDNYTDVLSGLSKKENQIK